MKHLPLFLLFLLSATYSFAQKRNVYFLKDNGKEVKYKDSADFIRIIQEPDSGSTFFKLMEFYPDNSRKFVGEVSSYDPILIYEGPAIRFNKNGKKTEQVSYVNGVLTGKAYYFYPNGRMKKVIDYTKDGMEEPISYIKSIYYKLLEYVDSNGVRTVLDGNGYAIIKNEIRITYTITSFLSNFHQSFILL